MGIEKITRTYPQPDSPADNIGHRERAMAVFKYLMNIEPEDATRHPLFACIVNSYNQAVKKAQGTHAEMTPSLAHEITGTVLSRKPVPAVAPMPLESRLRDLNEGPRS